MIDYLNKTHNLRLKNPKKFNFLKILVILIKFILFLPKIALKFKIILFTSLI